MFTRLRAHPGTAPSIAASRVFVLALFVAMVAAPGALAAPRLEVELNRDGDPGSVPVTHADERAVYDVTVTNVASAEPEPGTELSCDPNDIPNPTTWFPNPPDHPTFTYQWVRSGVDITSPSADPSYVIAPADEGHTLQCKVIGTNVSGSSVSLTPPILVPPVPTPAPAMPNPETDVSEGGVRPVVEPTLGPGLRTCTPPTAGSWSGSPVWSYQWLRNGVPIPGATSSTYLPKEGPGAEDQDKALQCMIIGTTGSGTPPTGGVSAASSFNTAVVSAMSPFPPNSFYQRTVALMPFITFSNTTSGPVTVDLELPGGQETYAFRVEGTEPPPKAWTCSKLPPTPNANASATCTRSDQLAPGGASYPPIELVIRPGRDAPDLLVTKATVSGGGAPTSGDEDTIGPLLSANPFGIKTFEVMVKDSLGNDHTQAGGHPFSVGASLGFEEHVSSEKSDLADQIGLRAVIDSPRVIVTDAPRGFVGNPGAVPELCPSIDRVTAKPSTCPQGSVVGGITLETSEGKFVGEPIYAMEPEKGAPAQFAFPVAQVRLAYALTPELRPGDGYAISLVSAPAPKNPELLTAEVTLCGFGTKPTVSVPGEQNRSQFQGCREENETNSNEQPFLTNPTHCEATPPKTTLRADSWEDKGHFVSKDAFAPALTGCDEVPFEPELEMTPASQQADSPTGMEVELRMPTEGLLTKDGIAQAAVKKVAVKLPEGMAINPSSAQGLASCGSAQIKLGSNDPISCPDASKVASVEVDTPLLDHTLPGAIYLAGQGEVNGSLLGLYLVIDSPDDGLLIKVPATATPDPNTGQLTVSFDDNPEAPFEAIRVSFPQGPRSALITPPACGTHRFEVTMSAWNGAEVTTNVPFKVSRGPGNSACRTGELRPELQAGSANPLAGATSPFSLRLSRADGTQRFTSLSAMPPGGLTAYLKGVPYCTEEAIASIFTALGTGQDQIDNPSCPAASQIGTVSAGAGAGPNPYYVDSGRLYLAGPYKGAPISILAVVPAVAGPLDLGSVVVRNAVRIDPRSAQITTVSDPIPTILHGLLLDVRDLRVELDRPGFALNPTSCLEKSVGVTVGGQGTSANASTRFQVGGCETLGFKPSLKLSLSGAVRRSAYQGLTATLRARPGDANIARTVVRLPHSAFLAQEHIGTVCTRVQFAADTCPKASVYGKAIARTPLLDFPIEGNVYLRSSDNPLPDLVADLRGPAYQPIRVELVGRTDSVKESLRNTFDLVPDAPVSYFQLKLFGGKKGLIVNSKNVCVGRNRATVRMEAQSGAERTLRPRVTNAKCKGKGKGTAKKGKGKKGDGRMARRSTSGLSPLGPTAPGSAQPGPTAAAAEGPLAAAASGPCPNDAIRSEQGSAGLPACMALELASPPLKRLQGSRYPYFSRDGSRLLFNSQAALADTPGQQGAPGDSYVATRTPGGWSTAATSPPSEARIFNGPEFGGPYAFSADLGRWALLGGTKEQVAVGMGQVFSGGLDQPFAALSPLLVPTNESGSSRLNYDIREASSTSTSPDLSLTAFAPKLSSSAYLPGDPRTPGVESGLPNQYLAFRDGDGNPSLELLARDGAGTVWGGQCGVYTGGGFGISAGSGLVNQGAIAPDGSRIYFTTRPSQPYDELAGTGPECDLSKPLRIMVREGHGEDAEIEELVPGDPEEPGDDLFQGASYDGTKVFFTTTRALAASDQDTGSKCGPEIGASAGCDLYLYDSTRPPAERVTQVSAGAPSDPTPGSGADVLSSITALSTDGSRAYFVAQGVLTTEQNPAGQSAQAGQPNLYVYERDAAHPDGRTEFIATLAAADKDSLWGVEQSFRSDATAVPSLDPSGSEANGDGHVLLFASKAPVTADDSDGGLRDLYRYDSVAGTLERVSKAGPGGSESGSDVTVAARRSSTGQPEPARWASEDGMTAAFATSEPLDPADEDGAENAYLWSEGEVAQLPGELFGDSPPKVSADGSEAVYGTQDVLLPFDGDTAPDVYVARSGGGFPNPVDPVLCQGEACQGALAGIPGAPSTATSSFTGPGNVKPKAQKACKPPKRKVKRKGKVRCVKPKAKKTKNKGGRNTE